MDISIENKYYYFSESKEVMSHQFYEKYINWIRGEFDLFQIDELEGLKVYCPGYRITIELNKNNTNILKLEINIKSKYKSAGLKAFQKIESVYNNLLQLSFCSLLCYI